MSHRPHLLVKNALEKLTAVLSLDEIAGEIEQELDVDIDNAEFLLVPEGPFSVTDIVDHIYADLKSGNSGETNLCRFDDLTRDSFHSTPAGGDNGQDKSLESRIQRSFRQLYSTGVLLAEPAAVHYYLLRHQDLIELLPEVVEISRKELGDHVQLSVELYEDPEVVDSYLAIYAREGEYQEDFLSVIQVAREKYSRLLANSSGWIHLTTDFDSPL